jgi:hypothetical protein
VVYVTLVLLRAGQGKGYRARYALGRSAGVTPGFLL